MAEDDALRADRRNHDLRVCRKPRFVVQRHVATSLHFDFRLEVGGVLKSWAVPDGPSPNPSDRCFATPIGDHPLDNVEFEGTIPHGAAGAGTVVVWDTGSYRNLTSWHGEVLDIAEALRAGHASVWLEGSKLAGAFALTLLGDGMQWLLVKVNDEKADRRANPAATRPESVLTGRTNADIASGRPVPCTRTLPNA